MLSQMALTFKIQALHGSDIDGVVTHGPRNTGEVERVGTRGATGLPEVPSETRRASPLCSAAR